MLAITTAVPGTYQTKTSGLMGNFNNDQNDDFIPRGETNPLPANINDSQIFEFGKTCKYLCFCLFVLICYDLVNSFSVMLGQVFLG